MDLDMEPLKKINFWRVMTFPKNGRHLEPEVESTFNVSTCLILLFALSRLNSISCNYCGL